jgi:aryl-alcohol dehydrogenase-like predicted oxidoreductase
MHYRKLGRSGLDVSEIALGGWLTIGGSVAEEDAIKLIHHAFDKGINLFDTAEVYAEGQSEIVFGKALSQLRREEVVIATKARGRWKGKTNQEGFSRKHLFEAVHASLKRLHIDYIDLYQLHWFDAETPLEETMTALNDLVRQGKVLYIGCSNFSTEQLRDALSICDAKHLERFISIQPPYSMFLRKIEETLLARCAAEGIGAIVFSPLAQGVLTGKYRPGKAYPAGSRATVQEKFVSRYLTPKHLEAVVKLEKIAKRLNKTLAQMALAWILRRKEVSSAIVGATSIKQLDENMKGSGWKLSAKDLEAIENILSEISPAPK